MKLFKCLKVVFGEQVKVLVVMVVVVVMVVEGGTENGVPVLGGTISSSIATDTRGGCLLVIVVVSLGYSTILS
ncbi:hypothetical protein M0804_009184 [Polistes exclamans]|nr:hypothetical protein M0804_009184 [Polistes exclamans]